MSRLDWLLACSPLAVFAGLFIAFLFSVQEKNHARAQLEQCVDVVEQASAAVDESIEMLRAESVCVCGGPAEVTRE